MFTSSNGRKNVANCCEWIKQNELNRSQIVSISMAESRVEDGDNVIVVVYRTHLTEKASDVPLDALEDKSMMSTKPWHELFKEFESFSEKKEVIALAHSARNSGNAHAQTAFYLGSHKSDDSYNLQVFENEHAEWKDVLAEAVRWMN